MVYSDGLYHPPIIELARAGNFQAIAHWLNRSLSPYGIQVHVGAAKPGCLKILVELPELEQPDLPEEWREYLIRFICHRIWQLNSAVIEGVRITARFVGESRILWQRSVRVVSPARQQRQQQSQEVQVQVRHTAQRKTQMKAMRAFLMSGTPLFAFIFGCVLGFSKAPVGQTSASASNKINPTSSGAAQPSGRSSTVRAALEVVPVIKHDQVADPNDPTVTLMFSGDVTLADAFADTVGKNYDQTFAAMDEYRKADLSMVNLENPLTRATIPLPGKQFNFKADPDSAQILEKGGVDLVTLANNHTMDYKEPGLVETMETLDKAGILHMGAGRDEKEARRPEIIDVKGQRVAYLAYYGDDFHAASDKGAGTNYADEARISADIKSIRDQVDWIVINFHWGEELATHPADWQIDLAHFTIDQGADLVVGHHPHVLQGAEIYKGRPIAYSLGNFIFGGNSRKDYDTAVMKVALKDKQMKVEFLPVEVRDFQPKVVTGDRASEILRQIDDLSSEFKQPMKSSAILDARQVPAGEPAIPSSSTPSPEPTPSPGPTTPSAPVRSYPFDPYAPTEVNPAPTPTAPAPTDTFVPPADSTSPAAPTAPAPTAPANTGVPTTESAPQPDPMVPSPEPTIPADMLVPNPASGGGTAAPTLPANPTDGNTVPSTMPGVAPANLNNDYAPTEPAENPGEVPPTSDGYKEQADTQTEQEGVATPAENSAPAEEAVTPTENSAPEPDSAAEPMSEPGEAQRPEFPPGEPSAMGESGEVNPSAGLSSAGDSSAETGTSKPSAHSNSTTDSFVNSPQQTPIQVPSGSSQPLIPMEFKPSEPAPIVTSMADPTSSSYHSLTQEQQQEQIALNQLAATHQPGPINSISTEATSGQPGSALKSNIALTAAVVW